MKKIYAIAVVSCALALQAVANIVIDNFNQGGVNIAVNDVTRTNYVSNSSLATTNTIGGSRLAYLIWSDGTDDSTLLINQAGDNTGQASVGSPPSSRCYSDLIYGSISDLNVDLTAGGTLDQVGVHYTFSDIAGTTTFFFVTSGGGTSTVSKANPMGGAMDTWVYFSYSELSGSASMTNIDRITTRIAGTTGADITVDEIVAIPEPTALALLGLSGVALLIRRRRS